MTSIENATDLKLFEVLFKDFSFTVESHVSGMFGDDDEEFKLTNGTIYTIYMGHPHLYAQYIFNDIEKLVYMGSFEE